MSAGDYNSIHMVFSNYEGSSELSQVRVIIGPAPVYPGSCVVQFVPTPGVPGEGTVAMLNANGDPITPALPIHQPGKLLGPYCNLDTGNSSAALPGGTLDLFLSLSFNTGGTFYVYGEAWATNQRLHGPVSPSLGVVTSVGVGSDLTIAKSHTGNFTQGQTGASYTITVTNHGAAATSATTTVTDTLPAGLMATSVSGNGWTCWLAPTLFCAREDSLAVSLPYPITLLVNVAYNAPASLTNTAVVSGGGESNAFDNTARDPTAIMPGSSAPALKEYIRLGGRVIAIESTGGTETITPPSLTGTSTVMPGVSYSYTANGAGSSLGHSLEYRFFWGDGASTGWSASATASHSWSAGGVFSVTVQARCAVHTSIISASAPYTVTVEVITTPSVTGATSGTVGIAYTYVASGATSNLGHTLQYQFSWGDGTSTDWQLSPSAAHAWSGTITYGVTVRARCATDTGIVSVISAPVYVTISGGQAPSVGPVSPINGSGAGATFSITFNGGSSQVEWGYIWISGPNSAYCAMFYHRAAGLILMSDNFGGWGGNAPLGTSPTGSTMLGNNQCELSVGSSWVSSLGNSITLNLAVSFNPNWQGTLIFWLSAANAAGYQVGPQYLGSWQNTQNYISVGPILPRNQAGAGALFTITANGGVAPLSYVLTVLSSSFPYVDVNHSCFVYFPAEYSYMYLATDGSTNPYWTWVGGAHLESTPNYDNPVLSNSQCTIDTRVSTVTYTGYGIYLNLSITFNHSWNGMKYFYMADGNTGGGAIAWPYMGFWQVQ